MATLDFYKEKFGLSSWKEVDDKQKEFLNKIDFIPYIIQYDNLDNLIDAIELDYDNTELTNNEFLQGNIFNTINSAEVADYIFDKYHIKYYEHITYQRDGIR